MTDGTTPSALRDGDAARLEELTRCLDVVRTGVPAEAYLATLARDLRGFVEVDALVLYRLRQGVADNQEVSQLEADGLDTENARQSFGAFVESQAVGWALYDTHRPQPAQRNRVLVWTADELASIARTERGRCVRVVYPQIGVAGRDQVRVVVCDGPSMLCWVGGFRDGPIEDRQQEIFMRLLPALRRRLRLERRTELRAGSRLGAALEALGVAAVVSDERGRIREMNALGRLRLARDPRGLREEIAGAAAVGQHPRWRVTRTESTSGAVELLMVADADDSVAGRVERVATHWGLTSRQRDVLAAIAEGHPNQTIAALLGIAERTVEVHVTALLERAGVDNRASLIARVHLLR